MNERERDDVFAAAIGEFRAAAMRQVAPPGPEAALRRARRRRRHRAAVLCTALVLLIALPAAAMAHHRWDRPPTLTASSSPTPSAFWSPSSSPDTSPTSTPAGQSPSSTRAAGTRPSTAGKKCLPGGYISVPDVGPPTIVEVDAPPFLCPETKLNFFWVTYRVLDKDTLVLAASGRSYVDLDHLRRSIRMPNFKDEVDNCTAAFIVLGTESFKTSISWTAAKEGQKGGSPYKGDTQLIKYPYHYYCDPPA